MTMADLPQMNPKKRLKILKQASWTGIFGNLALSGLKIIVGLITGSLAVVGDGLDSLSDVVTSMMTLFVSKAAAEPPDPEHPWGHGRAETIATKTLSLIIIMAGLQLLIMSFKKLTGSAETVVPGRLALIASGISVLGKGLLAYYKHHAGRITNSRMMLADAVNMKNDIILSLTVLIGVFFTRILGMPVIDILAGLLVSGWIIFSGVQIFLRTNTELMDSIDDKDIYKQVFEAVDSIDGVENPHRVRIRGLNSLYVIDMDVEVDADITVAEGHQLASRLEKEIRRRVRNIFDIMVHIEPAGVDHPKEGYGLSPEDMPL
jgi:cation diffusion facilitator family transporter